MDLLAVLEQILDCIALKVVHIAGHTVGQQLNQHLALHDIDAERLVLALAAQIVAVADVDNLVTRGQVQIAVVRRAGTVLDTDDGEVCTALLVLLEHFIHRDVGDNVAARNSNILALILVEHVADRAECLQRGVVVLSDQRGGLEGKRIRREHHHAAALARQIPIFTASQMIHQGLILVTHQDADLRAAGVYKVRQHKVDDTIASAERNGGYRTMLGKLPHIAVIVKADNNTKCIFHDSTSLFCARYIAVNHLLGSNDCFFADLGCSCDNSNTPFTVGYFFR